MFFFKDTYTSSRVKLHYQQNPDGNYFPANETKLGDQTTQGVLFPLISLAVISLLIDGISIPTYVFSQQWPFQSKLRSKFSIKGPGHDPVEIFFNMIYCSCEFKYPNGYFKLRVHFLPIKKLKLWFSINYTEDIFMGSGQDSITSSAY